MEVLLALTAALSYGVSDFVGGALTRRAHVVVVFLLSQLFGAVLLIAVVMVWADDVSWPGMGWGAAAGVAGVVGTSLLYKGLAVGRMSVVAPITAVVGAGLPVLFGLAAGERPTLPALNGIVIGLFAVVVVTRAPDQSARHDDVNRGDTTGAPMAANARQAIICAFGAGGGFGLFYILLERSPVASGLWPLVGTRVSIIGLLSLVVALGRLTVGIPAGMAPRLLGLGVVNTTADLLFLLATREGLLSLVAMITSMYPAVTVTLAAAFMEERIAHRQMFGLALAGVSIALIALG